MLINMSWKGNLAFEAETESWHKILLDAKREVGGEGKGPRPMEVFLVSLAGCTGMDVASILKKKRVNLEGMTVKINAEQAPEHPKIFTKINIEYNFTGKDIKDEDVKRAIELSQEKYCPVTAMLEEKAKITYKWNIINK